MSDNKILDALRQLEVGNDNHWTTDRLARIETVKLLSGDQSVTRDAIDKAAPGFTRDTATDYKAAGEEESGTQGGIQPEIIVGDAKDVEGNTIPQAPPLPTAPAADGLPTAREPIAIEGAEPRPEAVNVEQPSPVEAGGAGNLPPQIVQGTTMQGANLFNLPEDDLRDALATTAPSANAPESLGGPVDDASLDGVAAAGGASETQLGTLESRSAGDADEVASLEAELEEVAEYSAKLRGHADEVAQALYESTQRESAIRQQIETLQPRGTTMQSIQDYFASQDKVNQKTADARQALLDLGLDPVKLQQLSVLAPIDQALARSNSQ